MDNVEEQNSQKDEAPLQEAPVVTSDSVSADSPDQNVVTQGEDATGDVKVTKDKKKSSNKSKRTPAVDKGRVSFDSKVEIITSRRMPEYDHGPAKAYAACLKGEKAELYYALVCDISVMPRTEIMPKLPSLVTKSLVHFVNGKVLFWPPTNEQRFVCLYQNSAGKPLAKIGESAALGWKTEQVMSAFIHPMVNALLELRDFGLYHGAINLTNIYDAHSTGSKVESVVLGDFVGVSPGYAQPSIYEPLERSLADPISKGAGTEVDDIYALGVCIAMLIRSNDPMKGKTGKEIFEARVSQGTYMCLLGGETLSGPLLELLRLILYDQNSNRTKIEDLLVWLDGQRLAPKQTVRAKKASRSVIIDGKSYYTSELLSRALTDDVQQSVKLIDDGDLEQWITRALDNKEMGETYRTAIAKEEIAGRGPGYQDRLVSVASMVLCPGQPLVFKERQLLPDGLGFTLAYAIKHDEDVQPFVDILNNRLFAKWIEVQDNPAVDVGSVLAKIERARLCLRQKGYGFGVERAMYHLCPEANCMSPLLKGYFVRSSSQLLYALDDMLAKCGSVKPSRLVDRHVAAFLSVRDRGAVDVSLGSLNSKDPNVNLIGNIRILATIQRRLKLDNCVNITRWCAATLSPVYNRLHDKDKRKEVIKLVNIEKDKGDIGKILDLVDSGALWKKDTVGFVDAMREYKGLREEIAVVEHSLSNPSVFSKGMGQTVAAIVSGILSAIIIIGFVLIQMANSTL